MDRSAKALVILTLFLLGSHTLGAVFSLYERISWFDMVMHALGGAWLAAVVIAVTLPRFPALPPRFLSPLTVIGLVLVGGLLWEAYELGFAAYATTAYGDLGFYQSWADTMADLTLDIVGAAALGLLLLPRSSPKVPSLSSGEAGDRVR
jgi:hypothetical protein